ncbi:hypothetical protein LPJ72_005158 [Coemansia sp. Benny D160-2]|nr:hypothetical protein LPJ72_005158 [Coemansia sp. Benny D160-2]
MADTLVAAATHNAALAAGTSPAQVAASKADATATNRRVSPQKAPSSLAPAQTRTAAAVNSSKAMVGKRLAIVVPNDITQSDPTTAVEMATTQSQQQQQQEEAAVETGTAIGLIRELGASLPNLTGGMLEHDLVERPWSGPEASRSTAQPRADTNATLRGTSECCSPASSPGTRGRTSSSTTAGSHRNSSSYNDSVAGRPPSSLVLVEATAHHDSARESNWFRSQPLASPVDSHAMLEIEQLRRELEDARRQQRIEYELRTIAETKCMRMEYELAELSSNIQLEAQTLVAVERRGHKREIDRLTRQLREVEQLRDVDGEQVTCLKQCLESAATDLDEARAEVTRLRSAIDAFEQNQKPPQSAKSAAAAAVYHSEQRQQPHIAGRLFFGTDGTRADTRLGEFLGFLNVASEREAMASAFVQRCVREDVEPTLAASGGGGGGIGGGGSGGSVIGGSGMPSLSGWQRHRRLMHSVVDNSLVLEAFTPRTGCATRVLSLACYLCGHSTNPGANTAPVTTTSTSTSTSTSGSHSSMSSTRGEPLHRLRFGDNDGNSKPLCAHCHARMVAVCSFFSYLRIVRKGLIKRPIADIWLEVNKARLQMWLSRSGASVESSLAISDGL